MTDTWVIVITEQEPGKPATARVFEKDMALDWAAVVMHDLIRQVIDTTTCVTEVVLKPTPRRCVKCFQLVTKVGGQWVDAHGEVECDGPHRIDWVTP